MKVFISSDHSGIDKRMELINHLQAKGLEVEDLGTNETTSNYADLGIIVGEAVKNNDGSLGIVMCGTGIGISIACNKVKGIRCALVDRVENAKLVREHNNANVLALGARTTSIEDMKQILDDFFSAEFEGDRHIERLNTISEYEQNN